MKKIFAILTTLSIIFSLATVSFAADCTHAAMTAEEFDATCMSRAKTVYTCSCGYTETVVHDPEITIPDSGLYFTFEGDVDGNTLTVTCTAYNNPGVYSNRFTVYYNSASLTPESMDYGEVWAEDCTFLTINSEKNYIRFYADDWGNNTASGVVFTAKFTITDCVENWGFKVVTQPEDFPDFDTDENVPFTVKSTVTEGYGDHLWDEGSVTTDPTIWVEGVKTYNCTLCTATKTEAVPTLERWTKGDLDNDGNVNLADIFAMKKIIVGGATLSEQAMDAADFNDNGEVNLEDILLLKNAII